MNNKGAVQGVTLLANMIKNGQMPKGASYADMEAGVNKGNIAMMINGPWAWDNLKKSKINFGTAPIPKIGNKAGAPFVGVIGAMVNKASPNKELAVEFIENYMLAQKGLKTCNADVAMGVPADKAFYKELSADANIKAVMESAKNGKPMPNNPEMGRFWASMASSLQNITQGRQQPKEGLDAAAKRIVNK